MTQDVKENFSRAAAQYDAHATVQQQAMRLMLARALDVFPERATILDIGCGTGLFAEEAKKLRARWHITGVDHAPGMCLVAQRRCDVVHQAEATQLPIADASIDGVVSSFAMQWVTDKPAMLAETFRVLKPGGRAVLMTLADKTLHELRNVAARERIPLGLLAMIPAEEYRAMVEAFKRLNFTTMCEEKGYADVRALLRSIRAVGAGVRSEKPLLPSAYRRLVAAYPKTLQWSINATWERVLMVLEKPE